jgi:hypothetical protein
MKDRLRRGALVAVLALVTLAPAAHAGLSDWTSLTGLTESDGASWVRVYATGTPPTTMYAGTEGDGIYKTTNDGLSWSPFSTGLEGQGMSIRTIYTSGGKVYAGTDGGLFSAPDSTSAGGSWTPVAQGPETDPQHPTKLNAAVQAVISLTGGPMLAGTASFGVYKSTDGGNTWTPPAENNGMAAGTTVWSFASFANFVWAATSDGIYRSSNQGSTWTLASDGIPPGAITLGIFQDTQNPLIYYAETGSDGIYRSIDGAISWQPVNGDPGGEVFGGSSTPIVRAMLEFSGQSQTRLYTATSDGLWVGTLPNVTVPGSGGHSLEVPGQIVWRPVTQAGLGSNTIMWALSNFTNVPGTLLAGTQSNGGYSLTFEPPSNINPPSWFGSLNQGVELLGTHGTWNGTEQIDYDYQWQRCSTSSAGSCSDISGATDQLYTLQAADVGKYIRLVVAASNDFPTFGKDKAYSTVQGPVAAQLGPLPGENQQSAPAIVDVSPGGDTSLPTEGDTLSAPSSAENPSGWLFNPAATHVAYKWLRCDENGDNCAEIAGAKSQSYVLTAADDGLTLRVLVTGSNSNGATTLPVSAPTNPIIPLPAKVISPPTLKGHPYVGFSLVGSVGAWASPNTYWSRQWEQCEPDGSACSPIQGATSPSYTVRASDLGMRIRMHVSADVNPAYQLPLAVDAYTPLTPVITYAPGVKPPPAPGAPSLGKPRLTHQGGRAAVTISLSGPGSVRVSLQRVLRGHRKHGRCVAGRRKHTRRCSIYRTVLRLSGVAAKAGTLSIALPTRLHGHRLRAGNYRLVLTPYSPTGRRGRSRTLTLTLVHH